MQAYSMDLRVRVRAEVDQGLGTKATAEKFCVSPDWVRKLKQFRRQSGSFAARQQRVSYATKLDDQLPHLQQLVQEVSDATLRELRETLGVQVALGTVWRALKRLQITFKKVIPAAEQQRPDVHRSVTPLGSRSGWAGILATWSSSTRAACGPIWLANMDVVCAGGDWWPMRRTVIGRRRLSSSPCAPKD